MTQGSTVDLCVLPEGCISNILSLTSPRDACRSSVVSSVFRSSLDSDSVWERFLPSDYQQILSSSISPSPFVFSSKKELYLHLCNNPVLIDNGTKTFALEKCSGKKCYMIGAKALSVVGGDQPEHWCWGPFPDSRFSEVVQLLDICWLEVRGRMETRLLSPSTTYVAYMVFDFTESAFGFDYYPAEVSVKLAAASSGGEEVKAAYLDRIGRNMRQAANLDPMGKERQQFRQDQVKLQPWIMHRREDGCRRPTTPTEPAGTQGERGWVDGDRVG
ncbi:hypothetical protein NE237_015564 [Protea cynaroides]|uniref:F-box domain-containing protein n=1 Tax=Protea cynaroides TaxID=273540 RepID=A0A9Q0QR70_9MAGN|nr:hypothetical protein NE237_015564 [Protea cynaroides]